jgi:hypothetical protein
MEVFEKPWIVEVNCCGALGGRTAVAGAMAAAPTATVALALLVVSATLVAVTLWLPAAAGAVYRPDALIVPAVEFPPAAPSTDHVTAVFVVFCTVAANCAVAFTATFMDVWFSETLMFDAGGGVEEVEELLVPPQPASVEATANAMQPAKTLDLVTLINLNLDPESRNFAQQLRG